MHFVLVQIHVKTEGIDAFQKATMINAKNSIQESGIVRFDFLQEVEDPTRFTLVEVYRTPEDQIKHRETSHYQVWKETVTNLMAEPRVGIIYHNLYPSDQEWR